MDFIEIKGYKSIKDAKVELRPINILIGANGSGKSNFISFFEFLDTLYAKKLQEYIGLRGGFEKFLHKGIQPSAEIKGKIGFGGNETSYSFAIQQSGDSFVVSKETIINNSDILEHADFTKEAQVKNNSWKGGKDIQKKLVGYKKYHFRNTGKDSPFNSTSHILNDSLVLYDKGENIAAILYNIKNGHSKVYNRIVRTIQNIAPYFLDFILQPNETGFLKLFWQNKDSQYNYGVNDLSDGTIRFIALAVLFMQPNLPETIVLDEPELGLHHQGIGILADLIQSASRSSQIVIATQSADLISHFAPDDIIAVDQKEGGSIFQRLDTENLDIWLQEYSLGELWQRNILNKAQPFNLV